MKRNDEGTSNKVDVILSGHETIGSAERETDKEKMRECFNTIMDGAYKNKLYELNSTRIGTYAYCSPEILYKNLYHINSDIWSLGITIYGLLSKEKLFSNLEINNPKKIYKYINHLSPELQDLLKQIFVKNPKERISLEEIKKHQFLQEKES